ncbi:recombination protein RecR [Vagococcus coleopterorum]|uniref:Recombination protein RecR n=1 Tax=Vagococcus coleopterorum TaxID=2714946 RepID=A0A6G8AMP6_9ENTE|nr:recombination mediator RecR [Vagococcus coleopterorum]QIL46354.1 recombination protein RecR [Vagococcus coleopterorum]
MHYPTPIAKLIESYMRLPGIGAKTAARLAFFTLDMREDDVNDFAKSLISVKRDLHYCEVCGNITEEPTCEICQDQTRDKSVVLVVEETKDVMSLEKMREYKGQYHVLHGVLSPMDGTGPDDINIASLISRLHDDQIKEVIIATNATTEGEATAMYLSRLIKPAGIKVTRLAHGLSVGSDIEYADEITLLKAVEGRREL